MAITTPQVALTLRNVLVASDFSPCSEGALLHAVSVAHSYGCSLHFAYVLHPALFSMTPPEGYIGTPEAEEYAMKLARADAKNLIASVLHRTHCKVVSEVECPVLSLRGERRSR